MGTADSKGYVMKFQESFADRVLSKIECRKGSAQVDGTGSHLREDLHDAVRHLVTTRHKFALLIFWKACAFFTIKMETY